MQRGQSAAGHCDWGQLGVREMVQVPSLPLSLPLPHPLGFWVTWYFFSGSSKKRKTGV